MENGAEESVLMAPLSSTNALRVSDSLIIYIYLNVANFWRTTK